MSQILGGLFLVLLLTAIAFTQSHPAKAGIACLFLASLLVLSACDEPPPGYCSALTRSYEQCVRDPDCAANRPQWASSHYYSELRGCYGRIAEGNP